MEQRTWNRNNLALDVEIRLWRPNGEEVLRCKTLDVSLGGAELLTYDVEFPRHRVLEIHFPHLSEKGIKQPRILGKFIRKTDSGIAIQFRKANNETLKQLHTVITRDKMLKSKISRIKHAMAG